MSSALLNQQNAHRQRRVTASSNLPESLLADVLGFEPVGRFFSQAEPEIYVLRTENGYQIEIPVAGFKPQNVEIAVKEMTANEQVMTVSATSERRSFNRSLRLPEEIDPERIEAEIENGLLTLTLSRYPEAQPKKIPITIKANDG